MRKCVVIAVFSVLFSGCLLLQAQDRITVEQLVQFVRSSLAQNVDEKKVLDYLKHIQLTEKLTPETVESLSRQGASQRVVHALETLETQSAGLKPTETDPIHKAPPQNGAPLASTELRQKSAETVQSQGPPPPDSATREQMLDDMHESAENYTSNLPNFVCLQVTKRYVQQGAADIWHTEDTIAAKLSYNEHQENVTT